MGGENVFAHKVQQEEDLLGYLKNVSTLTVIQALQSDEKTCTVLLFHHNNGERGGFTLYKGQLIHAWTEHLLGEEAAIEILVWNPVDASIYTMKKLPPKTIHRSLDELTLEAFTHNDEILVLHNPHEILKDLHLEELEVDVDHHKKGGSTMAKDKLRSVLESLSELGGYEGSAIISDEGLIMASHFIKEQPEDVVAALVQETVNMAQKVIEQAKWGKLDNLVIESQDDHKLILYKTKLGFVALFGNKSLNLGLARVTVDDAAENLEKM
jgi:predicted regulator of Ras-like GTPase activity (Roadblock/LC7/MglB family)